MFNQKPYNVFHLKLKIGLEVLYNKFLHVLCHKKLMENNTIPYARSKLNFYALGNKMVRLVLFCSFLFQL